MHRLTNHFGNQSVYLPKYKRAISNFGNAKGNMLKFNSPGSNSIVLLLGFAVELLIIRLIVACDTPVCIETI